MDDNEVDALKARLAEVEGQRAELASKLSHLVDSLKHAEARALAASRPATQVVDREAVARLVSDKDNWAEDYPVGSIGAFNAKGRKERALAKADAIISLLRPAEPVEAEGVGEPKPAGWQRSLRYANAPVWEQCSTSEATSQFDRSPYHDYRPFYTHPPKSPDTSAAVLQRALEQALNSLAEIASSHIPDCPAHYAGEELAWAQRHVGCLRQKAEIARDGIAAAIRQLPTTERGDK